MSMMWTIVLWSILSVVVLVGGYKGVKVLGEKKKYRELESKGVADWKALSEPAKRLLGMKSEYYGGNGYYSTLESSIVVRHCLKGGGIYYDKSIVESWAETDYEKMLKLWAADEQSADISSHLDNRYGYIDTHRLAFEARGLASKAKEGVAIESWSDFAVHSILNREGSCKIDYSELSDEEWDRVIERYIWKFFRLWENDYRDKSKIISAAKRAAERSDRYVSKLAYVNKSKLELTPSEDVEDDSESKQWDEAFKEIEATQSEKG